MKATLENLKANRDMFVDLLKESFDEEAISSKMSVLKDNVEYSEMFNESREIEDIISDMIKDVPPRRKTSKSAEMIAEMAERRGEVWNSREQKFNKI